MSEIQIRKAGIPDCGPILKLVNQQAREQILLPRSPASVIEHIRDFYVAIDGDKLIGCGALHIVWTDMAEVRSIVVDDGYQGRGIGRLLIDHMVEEAEFLRIPKLFAFTYEQQFFEAMGFSVIEHSSMPHKVFNDCLNCPKFTCCDEIAMERVLFEADQEIHRFGAPVSPYPVPRKPVKGEPGS